MVVALAALAGLQVEFQRDRHSRMAATAASIAASASSARPRLVCSTVPVRLNNGRSVERSSVLKVGERLSRDALCTWDGAPSGLQSHACFLQCGADSIPGGGASEALKDDPGGRRIEDRVDRQIAQTYGLHSIGAPILRPATPPKSPRSGVWRPVVEIFRSLMPRRTKWSIERCLETICRRVRIHS